MYLAANKLPPVSEEFLAALRNAFRPRRITPQIKHEEVLWDAAQQEVIEWVARYAGGSVVIGNPEALERQKPQPWWRRLFKWRS
jgi:hypothetical protein